MPLLKDIQTMFSRKNTEGTIAPKSSPVAKLKQAIFDLPVLSRLIPAPWTKARYYEALVGWTFACVSTISDTIGEVRLRLYKVQGKKVTELFDHEILDLIYKPNSVTTGYDLMRNTVMFLETTGEAPWLLDVPAPGQKPRGIYLLRPDRLAMEFNDQKTDPDNIIKEYKYLWDGARTVSIAPKELALIKYPNPTNLFRGRATIEAMKDTIDIDQFMEEWNKNFFYNAAVPAGVLKTEKSLSDTAFERLKKLMKNEYAGVNNAHKTMILDNGLEYQPKGWSQKEMDFSAQTNNIRDKILAIFRVPKSILGISEDVNRANAEAAYYTFAKYCIKPKLRGIVEYINEFVIVPYWGAEYYVEFDDPVPEDVTAKMTVVANALQNGWLTRNEVRVQNGYDIVDNEEADKLYIPNSMVEIGTRPTLPSIGLSAGIRRRMEKNLKRETKKKKVTSELQESIKDALRPMVRATLLKEKEIRRRMLFNTFSTRVTSYETELDRVMRAMFAEQEESVLAEFDTKKQNFIILNDEDYIKKYGDQVSEVLIELVKKEGTTVLNELKKSTQKSLKAAELVISEQMRVFIQQHSFKLIKDITATTRKKLQKQYQESLKENEGVDGIRKRIKEVFNEATTARAQRIARTESSRAANYANEQSYIASGVVVAKEWLVDNNPCPVCEPLDGLTAPLGGKFAGVYSQPPDPHPNCECTTIPVLEP